MAELRIGTSGWSYKGWNERFYPAGFPRRRVLAYNARCFNSVELNGSFYSLQKPASYRRWYAETPPGFVFAVKGSRFITHNKKLVDVTTPLANFFASGLLLLEEKLGPLIWQLPATSRFDATRLASFFALLPRDTAAAARLAHRHDARVEGRCWTKCAAARPLRHALEVRNPTFFSPEVVRLARRYRIALVISDAATWPRIEELTANFVYIRLHGAARTYASGYSDDELDGWASRIRCWRSGGEPSDARRITDRSPPRARARDVYVYFDNDYEANAPNDARRLAERISPSPLPAGGSDEIGKWNAPARARVGAERSSHVVEG